MSDDAKEVTSPLSEPESPYLSEDKDETASDYLCLNQISRPGRRVWLLVVFIFPTLRRSRNETGVLRAREAQELCGLCLDVSVECAPLKVFKIILAVKLSPGRGPERCHPYQ